ncbi:major surface protease gp63 [Novymonas esmeraldas]|uniref:Leishmanolysin-like peptidase n=1 Tax=Novymonas esmeraldas TaxID=1808958 RepID=A0AAW0F5Z1_9TRYP
MCHSGLRTAVVVAVLLCASVWGRAAQPALVPTGVEEHRCGFDELQERKTGTRVSRVSHVAHADADERSMVTASTAWQPIRIAVFTDDIADSSHYCTAAGQLRPNFTGGTVTCRSADVLTHTKKQTLLELLIPSAVELHGERLNVQREGGNIVVNSAIRRDSVCGQFSIPASHTTTGVANADFMLYMSAGPTSGGTIACATTCQNFANGRPSVGVSNVSPMYITADPQTVRVVAHEILHALGFSFSTFSAQSIVGTAAAVRGKPSIPVVTSPTVVAQAQAQYGCGTQAIMELEDMGGSGTAYSHWKRRSAKDELMAGISGVGYYTALSIAAMEDLGYYKGNYAMAEPMVYGQNAGCGLLTDKCVANSVSQFPAMFCESQKKTLLCTSDRMGVGYCAVSKYGSSLPAQFQYFSDSGVGGGDALMDYCPFVQVYRNTNCTVDGGYLVGGVYGVMSRCFDTPKGFTLGAAPYAQLSICVEVQCATSTYAVRLSRSSGFTACPSGAEVALSSLSLTFSSGYITCPSYDSVCAMRLNATHYEEYMSAFANGSAPAASIVLAVMTAMLALLVG